MSQTASPKFGAVETTDKHDTTPLSSLPPTEKRTNDIEEKLAANTIRNDAVISGHHASQQMSRHDGEPISCMFSLRRVSDRATSINLHDGKTPCKNIRPLEKATRTKIDKGERSRL
jgi:hypothetical protein